MVTFHARKTVLLILDRYIYVNVCSCLTLEYYYTHNIYMLPKIFIGIKSSYLQLLIKLYCILLYCFIRVLSFGTFLMISIIISMYLVPVCLTLDYILYNICFPLHFV